MLGLIKKIHMVGIGGSGMNGIAEILMELGYRVSGTDLKKTAVTERLVSLGATINYAHDAAFAADAQVIVTSSAVRSTNPEVCWAKGNGIPVIPRAEMLAELMRLKKGIAISGTHGKTTTTSMIGAVLAEAGLDPTVVVGGRVKTMKSGARLGSGVHMVCEADESDGSFLKLAPVVSVVTNIDPEHLDHYGDFDHVRTAYQDFIARLPFWGLAILCSDHPEVRALAAHISRRKIFYGLGVDAELKASRIESLGWESRFDVIWKGEWLGSLHLQVPGIHNVQNSLAAVAVGLELEIPFEKIKLGLGKFHGMERRLERLGPVRESSSVTGPCAARGLSNEGDIQIVDDYAHHPEEIRMTLAALRALRPTRILALFQPHRFSRTRELAGQFGPALAGVDRLWISEIYPAGEEPIPGIDGMYLVDAVKSAGIRCEYAPSLEAMAAEVLAELKPGDVFVTLGAGDVGRVSHRIAEQLGKEAKLCS